MLHNLRESIAHRLCEWALCSCPLCNQPGLYAVALWKRGLAYFVSECLYFKSVSPVHFIYLLMIIPRGFLPWWLSSKQSACQHRRCGFHPWGGEDPWRRKWQPTPVFLPRKSHGQRSLVDFSPWGCKRIGHTHKKKNWTRLSDSKTRGFLHLRAYGATTEFVGTDLLTQANDFQQFLGEE